MEILSKIVYLLMLLSSVGIIILVLLQHGKGADMGTGFGAGASGSLFGATGSANFLSRTTAVLAAIFFASTLALSYFATNRGTTTAPAADTLPAQLITAPSAPVKSDNGVAPAASVAPSAAPATKGNDIPK